MVILCSFVWAKKKDSDVMILVHAKEQADQVLYFDLKEVRTCCPSSPQYEVTWHATHCCALCQQTKGREHDGRCNFRKVGAPPSQDRKLVWGCKAPECVLVPRNSEKALKF